MKVVILHNRISDPSSKDEMDVLVQADAVSEALSDLGYEPVALPFGLDMPGVVKELRSINPGFVFNIVESVEGKGSLIHLAPALLDFLKILYTGAGTDAMFTTSNKILGKTILKGAGIPTPPWFTVDKEVIRIFKKSVYNKISLGTCFNRSG